MYRKILIPIDLAHSKRIEPMMAVARALAGEDAQILLLSVVDQMPGYVESQLPASVLGHQEKEVRERLDSIARQAANGGDVMVRSGKPAEEILAVAKENGTDLIVIASHKPGFGDFLIGSTAADVVRHAPCSVHVVRETS